MRKLTDLMASDKGDGAVSGTGETGTTDTGTKAFDIGEASIDLQRLALEAAKVGVWEMNPATQDTYFDHRVLELFGLGLDERLTFEQLISLAHPDDAMIPPQQLEDALDPAGTGAVDVTFRILPADGAPMRWIRALGNFRFEDGVAVNGVGTLQDVTLRNTQAAENGRLINELEHRVKNTLATAVAVVDLSRIGHSNIDEYQEAVSARLRSMAKSHDALLNSAWSNVSFNGCVLREAEDLTGPANDRFTFTGPELIIAAKHVQTVMMVIHELFINSMKYGAFSNDVGTVHLDVELGNGYTKATWTEEGGPPIEAEPEQQSAGFGSVLLTQILPAETGATVTRTFAPPGFRCEISMPYSRSSK